MHPEIQNNHSSCGFVTKITIHMKKLAFIVVLLLSTVSLHSQSWTADNGNGTYTNPLFYDEFSDPDIIRVGSDFYLAGTTMHAVPGLVILHSRDLVNWDFCSYACPRINVGEEFNLSNGKETYGQGIWAPCIRYHNGTFYVFSNINRRGLQLFTSKNPAGPWHHTSMGRVLHDLSVLFDDDGKIYAVFNYNEVHIIEMKPDLSGYVDGSERVIIPAGNAMGEGNHFYKINGKYYIVSASYAPCGRMQCARADSPFGPYETVVISDKETQGYSQGPVVMNVGQNTPVPENGFPFRVKMADSNEIGCSNLHQGGIVDLPNGDWWGFSMLDFHSVGRTTCLSPVTWKNGWPYFGLDGNMGRSPRTWTKPNTGNEVQPHAPYQRSDDFNGKSLLPVWQWNHNPVDGKWSLTGGRLRLCTLPAKDFLWARNTLTQRGIGPVSIATVKIDARNLKDGDIAGLALLNIPDAWIGTVKEGKSFILREYKQQDNKTVDTETGSTLLWLRATGDFDSNKAQFSYSTDGKTFRNIGDSILMPYQLKTFQGTRYALFAYNSKGKNGGYAEFDDFTVDEPLADRSGNIPFGETVMLTNIADGRTLWANPLGMLCNTRAAQKVDDNECLFHVIDCGQGRVMLESLSGRGFLTVTGEGLAADVRLMKEKSDDALFVWQDLLNGHCMLLSLKTHRYIGIDVGTNNPYSADIGGPTPDCRNGVVLSWKKIIK